MQNNKITNTDMLIDCSTNCNWASPPNPLSLRRGGIKLPLFAAFGAEVYNAIACDMMSDMDSLLSAILSGVQFYVSFCAYALG